MTRIMIVDDQEMIRVGLRAILEAQDGFDIVADIADGLAALDLLATEQVDVALMDIRMPGIDGVETVRRIRATGSPVRIIILTTFDNDENVFAALRAGANGFLSKGAGPSELEAAIIEVAGGGGALSANAAAALIDHVSSDRRPVSDASTLRLFAALTPRERDMVVSAAEGLDNSQIAAQMFISPLTVKTHVNRAMIKLGARDRAQLVTLVYRAGLMR